MATRTSLEKALRALAQKMNPDEDVLLLYLTSHGSEEHELRVHQPPLPFDQLTPERLRAALDASGIRWRVLVVSACYSGGFTAALRADSAIVATASAANRRSFGCSNEAEWTYFGRAYFDEALRATHSFTRAFEQDGALLVITFTIERGPRYDVAGVELAVAVGRGHVPLGLRAGHA